MIPPSVNPGESPIEHASVPLSPAHVGPTAAAVIGPLEQSSGQQDLDSGRRRPSRRLIDFMGGQSEGNPDQLPPDDHFGGRRPPSVQLQQRRPDAVIVVGDGPDPDLPSTNSGSRRPATPAQGCPGDAPAGGHWLPGLVGFSVLTSNTVMATYRAWGDIDTISFVASTYFILLSLFFSIKKFQAAPPNSKRRNGLKACVWILTMALTFGFVYQIIGTTTKPTLHLTLLLWTMPAATGVSVFIVF